MRHSKRMLAATMLVSVLATFVVAAPASAAKPESTERFVEPISGDDPFLAAVCGVDNIVLDGSVRVHLRFYEDGLVRAKENLNVTITNLDTGDQVVVTQARTVRDRFEVIEGDGVIVERGELSFTGSAEKWRAVGGGGVIIADAGRLVLSFEVVLDAETFELISINESTLINGPHPIWEQAPFESVCPMLGGSFQGFPEDF